MENKTKTSGFALISLAVIILLFGAVVFTLIKPTITGFATANVSNETTEETQIIINETTTQETQTINETTTEIINQTIINEIKEKGKPEKEEKPAEPEKPEPNQPPVWKADADELIINGKTVIDLNEYFSDKNNDVIGYAAIASEPDKISITIDGNLAVITPADDNFNSTITIVASDGDKSTTKEVTLIVPKRQITIDLKYKTGSIYDSDDDGVDTTTGIIDLTVENTLFSWDADENNLCTRWETYSVEDEESTLVCYGSSKCCQFVGLLATKPLWNEPFYSSYGTYGATYNNIVSAQVLYVDYELNVDEPFAEVYNSEWSDLRASYFSAYTDFENVCVESCLLEGFNDTSYNLIFEIEDAVLELDTLTYTLVETISQVLINLDVEDNKGVESGNYNLYKNNVLVTPVDNLVEPDYYDIEIIPKENVINKLIIKNANITAPLTASIGIDNVSREQEITDVEIKKQYAIDASSLDFETATLTATAEANSLYKCRQWDYDTEVCYGTWEKIKDLVIGEEYELTITADDPGFVEGDLNITSINVTPINITELALINNISNIIINKNNNASIDLSEYFLNIGDDAIFTYFEIDNITILFENNIATIVPDKEFVGIKYTYITANQSNNLVVSNVFSITVTNETLIALAPINATKIPIDIFDDEQWAYYYWKKAQFESLIGENNVLVHLDKHTDNDGVFRLPKDLVSLKDVSEYVSNKKNIENWNFISAAVYDGLIKEVYWLAPEFVETAKDTVWRYKLEDEGLELLEPEDKGVSDYDVVVHVINSPAQIPNLENESVLLGIDIDYFLYESKERKDISRDYNALNVKIDNVMGELERLEPKSITISKDRLDEEFVKFMKGSLNSRLKDIFGRKNLTAEFEEEVLDYKKHKDDPGFDVAIEYSKVENDNLVVVFSHDSASLQPITIIGDINYNLDKQAAEKDENATLTVFNYTGREYFRLKVGFDSEEIDFGQEPVITFDRDLSCQRCGKHKAPPLTTVNMTVTADITGTVLNENLTDYYENTWTVVEVYGGVDYAHNATHNKVVWSNVTATNITISRNYLIRSPQVTNPSTNYYFDSELANQSSDSWRVIVADPTGQARVDVDTIVAAQDFSPCTVGGLTSADGTACIATTSGAAATDWLQTAMAASPADCTSTVSSAIFYFTLRETGGPEEFIVHYSDNGIDTSEVTRGVTGTFAEYSYEVTTSITTCALADQAGIWFEASNSGRPDGTSWQVDEAYLNITYLQADLTPPFFPTSSINNSNPKINEVVGIGQNATDFGNNISMVIFAHNQSGLMINVSNTSNINTKSINYTPNLTITLVRGNVIEYRFWANDTSTDTAGGNVNTTDATEIRIFTVANSPPETPTILNPADDTEVTVTTEGNPIELNITFPADADNDAITIYYYIDGKLNQTSSVNTTLNASLGAYILNISLTDGVDFSANASINFTIITDTIAPIVNASLNKSLDTIYSIDVINLTANATDDLELSFGQIIVNDTGFKRYFNFSLSGKVDKFSQNISISCDAGCVINFTARANDTSNNFRTNDTIIEVLNIPPEAFGVQCNNGSNWTACDVFNFKDTFEAVRLECTDDGPVRNVTFNFSNVNDGKTFFLENATKDEGDFWILNNTDITITDSGAFNVTALCYDSVLATDFNFTSFELAFGVINITFITSNSSLNMTKDLITDIEVNIQCTGGECGDVNATLDPFMQHYSGISSETIPKDRNIGTSKGAISAAKPLAFIKNIFQRDILLVSAAEENKESAKESILTRILSFIKGLSAKEASADAVKELRVKQNKTHFNADETPEFDFDIGTRGNLITGFATGVSEENVKAKLIQPNGKEIVLGDEVIDTEKGIKIKLDKRNEFKPGLYKLIVETTINGVTTIQEQEFTWGVLAINVNKSIYLPNEDSFIGIAVLDDQGHMVCDADVTLEIINPLNQKTTLTTANNNIKISQECEIYGVTNLPDYYTAYSATVVGNYAMNLTAVTKNGIRTIEDSFIVQNNVEFDVARQGPTRIFPVVPYNMDISIIANQNYNGIINEYVPASFAITPQQGLKITTIDDSKILSWNVNLKKDETIKLNYEFDAPDISPEFYLLGPLQIGTFTEIRNWQIASDAVLRKFWDEFTVSGVTIQNWTTTDTDWQSDGSKALAGEKLGAGRGCDAAGSNMSMTNNVDLSDCGSGTAVARWIHNEVGAADADDCLRYQTSTDGGTTWSAPTQIMCDDLPDELGTEGNYTIPGTPSQFKFRFVCELYQFGSGAGEQVQIYMFNITCQEADIVPPFFPTFSINNTQPTTNEVVNLAQNATDTKGNIDMVIFFHNQTGLWRNVSNTSNIDVKSINYTPNLTITLLGGGVIGYGFWANDTSTDTAGGNVNTTEIRTISVVDKLAPVINGTLNKSLTTIFTNDVINATYNTTDEVELSFGQVIINQTGANEIFNFSLGTGNTAAQFSQKFTISCDFGCVINITGIANDTSNNLKQNETIFTVGEQIPPNVTLVSPENNAINTTHREIVFKYNVTDQSVISSCSLEISGKINNTVNSPAKEITNIITGGNFSNADYNWSVSCSDTAGNANSSLNRTISIQFLNETKGIISTTIGATPFFTRTSNPNSSCTELIDGDNCIVKWRVNASGSLNERYVFFAFANATNYSANVYHNETIRINITIVSEAPQAGPDTTAPAFSNRQPANDSSDAGSSIQFNITITEVGGSSVNITELWHNASNGIWQLNQSDNWTDTGKHTFNITNFGSQTFIYWAVFANDSLGNFNWTQNFTFKPNTAAVSDNTQPIVNTSLNKSLTDIFQGDVINLTANVTDNVELANGTIIINASPAGSQLTRHFNFSLEGKTTAQISQNITIDCDAGCVINFTVRVNDTSGNYRTNDTIITVISAATAPIIKLNNVTIGNVNPSSASDVYMLISFNVTDAQGVSNINASKAVVNLTAGGKDGQWRSNVSDQGGEFGTCTNDTKSRSGEDDRVVINCTVALRFYDNASVWFINASVKDITGLVGRNDTISFTYNSLASFNLKARGVDEAANLNFTSLFAGQTNVVAKAPLLLNNTGNNDFDQINITGADLTSTTTSDTILASAFAVNVTNNTGGLGLPISTAPQVIPNDDLNNATLLHGPASVGDTPEYGIIQPTGTKGNQTLIFFLDVPSSKAPATYNNTWNITVVDLS